MSEQRKNIYGWVPDLPDHRDHKFSVTERVASQPLTSDLRAGLPDCYNQGQLGSCVSNAIAGAFEFVQKKEHIPVWMPSRLFIYYNARVIEHTVSSDSGAMVRDGIKSINTLGVCPETQWPYTISKFKTKPSSACYKAALQHIAVPYARLETDINQMTACLAGGNPFVFGFTVYESFESDAVAKTGIVPMPAMNESVLGGHAVLAVGYKGTIPTGTVDPLPDVPSNTVIVRNSWGTSWGAKGYFFIPYAYITNTDLVDDLWSLSLVR